MRIEAVINERVILVNIDRKEYVDMNDVEARGLSTRLHAVYSLTRSIEEGWKGILAVLIAACEARCDTIQGRWAGDRIVLVGERYDNEGDFGVSKDLPTWDEVFWEDEWGNSEWTNIAFLVSHLDRRDYEGEEILR